MKLSELRLLFKPKNTVQKFQEGGSLPSLFKKESSNVIDDANIFLEKINKVKPMYQDSLPRVRPTQKPRLIVPEEESVPVKPAIVIGKEEQIPKFEVLPNIVPKKAALFSNDPDWDNYANFLNKREMSGKKDKAALKRFNDYGYVGAFQFGVTALQSANRLKRGRLHGRTQKEKILNPNNWVGGKDAMNKYFSSYDEQKNALLDYTKANYRLIKDVLAQHNITDPGEIYAYLTAAHLGGHRAVKNYLNHSKVKKDGYGTKITDYINGYIRYTLKNNKK